MGLLFCLAAADSSRARTLEEALVSTFPGVLADDARGLATVFAHSVAASFPITGTSASYVYRFDPATDAFQRSTTPLGPVFSERAEGVGRHKLSLKVDYALVQYDTINGRDVHALLSHDPRTADHIAVCAGPALCEPVAGLAQVDLEAQIVTVSATYGVTPDLDINVLVPVVRTYLRTETTFTGPDPRVPSNPNFFPFQVDATASETSTGVGDLLLRAKYLAARTSLVDVAGGLALSLPTGARADFQGTGDTLATAAIYASRTYAERLEPHVNLSFVWDADKFDRSQVRYSAGADVRLLEWLTLNLDFLGRSDIAQADPIDRPVFVGIERSDVFQLSTGLKTALPARITGFFNAVLPLNEDGLRSDRVLAFGVERVF